MRAWVLSIWLALPLQAVLAAECPRLTFDRSVQVRKVIDGDTVRLDSGQSVRLIGINAPEIGRDGRPDQPGAQAARRALQQVLAGADRVALSVGTQATDHYGRALAHLYVEGRSVEQLLVERGLAFAVAIAPNLRLADCLFEAEREARAQRRGLWRDQHALPVTALQQGGFAWLQGRVSGVFETRRAWYVEVDDLLAVKIGRAHLNPGQERVLQRLQHQRVQLRGWVVDRWQGGSRQGQKRWLISITDLRNVESIPD